MAAKIAEYKETIDQALHDNQKPWTGWLALAEEKTGIKRLYLFIGELLDYSRRAYLFKLQ